MLIKKNTNKLRFWLNENKCIYSISVMQTHIQYHVVSERNITQINLCRMKMQQIN